MIFRWKYVIIEHPGHGMEMPIIFPESLEHSHVAKLGHCGRVLGAGFCTIDKDAGTATTYGESEGLLIKPREVDAKLLRLWFIGTHAAAAASNSPKEIQQ